MPRWLFRGVQFLPLLGYLTFGLWVGDLRAAENGQADVVLRHGKIYTADSKHSIRQSIAFRGNSIVAIGDDDEVAPLIGPNTKVVDLGGKLVLPGLIDTHIHPIDGAVNGAKCSLADVIGEPPTIEALKPVIRKCLAKSPGCYRHSGRRDCPDDWFEAVQLYNYGFKATAHELDSIEKTRPIALAGNDGHTMWVNSRGLALLRKNTADPRDGRIDRDSSGAPTGFLIDGEDLVEDKIPELPLKERASLTAAELKKMLADGITSLMDPRVGPDEEDVWLLLYRTGRLPMRVRMALHFDEFADNVDKPYANIDKTVKRLVKKSHEVNKKDGADVNFLRAGEVKVFADGAMEYPSLNAALLAPYLDRHGNPTKNVGKLTFDSAQPDEKKQMQEFAHLVTKLDKAGLAVHVHAIGDRAVRASLDAFAAARKANGDRDNRHQIAHLELVDPNDFPRFKALGVIADMQLLWAQREPATEVAVKPYLGSDRYRYLYPAGSLRKAGATIVGGSDWDVTSYNPFCAIQTAVTRSGGKGQEPLNIDERIPLKTAVDAYTRNAAFALKQEATTGSLEVGKRADLVVLDRDIFSVDPFTIADTNVLKTYLDGRLVYKASGNEASSRINRCD
jgi:predicted amidohydrolase YtcJ